MNNRVDGILLGIAMLLLGAGVLAQETPTSEVAPPEAGTPDVSTPDSSESALTCEIRDGQIVVGIAGQLSPQGGAGAVRPSTALAPVPVSPTDDPLADNASDGSSSPDVHIVAIYSGEVKLDGGTLAGIGVGNRFEVFRQVMVERKHMEQFKGEKLVANIEVVAVNKNSAIARVARGDRLKKSDVVRPTTKPRDRYLYPRRIPLLGEVSITIRPLLNVGRSSGFGGLVDARGAYYFNHSFAQLRLAPMGFGFTDKGKILTSTLVAEGGYDGRAFSVGLGAGVAVVNGDMDSMLSDYYYDESPSDLANSRKKAAFALSQVVRLGAREGLNMVVSNTFIYTNDSTSSSKSGFIYGGTTGRINIPLGSRVDMFLNGGGGLMGYGFGELGIFAWLRGNGDGGSIGISGAAGGAGVWVSRMSRDSMGYISTDTTTVAGPLVSLGLTYRFTLAAK